MYVNLLLQNNGLLYYFDLNSHHVLLYVGFCQIVG